MARKTKPPGGDRAAPNADRFAELISSSDTASPAAAQPLRDERARPTLGAETP